MLKTLVLNLSKYFPFLLKTVKYEPTSIVISLTNRCNCRCIMCNYWKFPPGNELTTEEVRGILKQAKDIGIIGCVLYGGEPLLRSDIFDIVSYAHKIGMNTKIITNGLLLDKDKIKLLLESGIDGISISIDATSSLLDEIRGVKDAHLKAISALNELTQLRQSRNFKLSIGALLMFPTLKDNDMLKVVELGERLKVPVNIQLLDFSFFYFKGVEEKTKNQLWIKDNYQQQLNILVDELIEVKKQKPWLIENSIPALQYIKKYFKNPKSRDTPCYIAFSGRIWISPEGKVFLCQGLAFVGDLRKEPLKSIIFSQKWRQGVYNMFKKQCPGCSCMYSSNVDAHIPLAWKEMLFRRISSRKNG
jgi:MoaA/NifB/PqqE/SkfB family radical SAM enzyme